MISQGQNQILIDGGPSGQKEMEKLGKYIPFWDRKIEIVIATHPDQDHIGGLIDVMKNYKIGKVIDNSAESDSQVYKNYLEIIENKNIERLKGKEGMNIKIKDANLEIIYPGLILDPPAGGPFVLSPIPLFIPTSGLVKTLLSNSNIGSITGGNTITSLNEISCKLSLRQIYLLTSSSLILHNGTFSTDPATHLPG